jgi:hypothetical protein
MSTHRAAMRDMGDISLLGVVDIMTGEKDPRNLMIVFSILKVVMVEWDISNHIEVCKTLLIAWIFQLILDRHSLTQYTITSQLHSGLHQTTLTELPHRI